MSYLMSTRFWRKNFSGFHRIFPSLTLHQWQINYILRCSIAAGLALFLAYYLELQMPYSAVATVLLVINPTHGVVLAKGMWRFLGTIFGMVAAFVLVSLFSQKPWLFIMGFAIWIGLCVAAMSLLRHFRASGAVVAGYTIGLATYGAMQHPEFAFDHIFGRGATVFIGILCLSIVTILFNKRPTENKLKSQIASVNQQLFEHLADQFNNFASGEKQASKNTETLLPTIYQLDDLLAVAKSESSSVAYKSIWVRHAMALLANAAITPLPMNLSQQMYLKIAQCWTAIAQEKSLSAQIKILDEIESICLENSQKPALGLLKLVDDIRQALNYFAMLDKKTGYKSARNVVFIRSFSAAWENGSRAAITLFLAGALWLITGWQHGDMMLLVLAPYCSLLATVPNPVPGSKAFFRGTLCAIPAACLCTFAILPLINGFPLLLVVLMLFWLPGIYATSVPKYGLTGLAYLVAFTILTDINNPIQYDFERFLNWSLAWAVATFFAWMGFLIILPKNIVAQKLKLYQRILNNTVIAFNQKIASPNVWQQKQQHRLILLANGPLLTPALIYTQLGVVVMQWKKQLSQHDQNNIQYYLSNIALRLTDPKKALLHIRKLQQNLLQEYKDSPSEYTNHYHFSHDMENLLLQLKALKTA